MVWSDLCCEGMMQSVTLIVVIICDFLREVSGKVEYHGTVVDDMVCCFLP